MSQPRDDIPNKPDKDGAAGGPLIRLFTMQLLAVLAITVLLTGAFALIKGGDSTDTTSTDTSTDTSSTSTALDRQATSTPPATPPASPSTQPTGGLPSTPASTPASTPTGTPPAASPSTSAPADQPQVVVFNQNGPADSGPDAARRLRDKGWTVFKVDDFRGNVTTTTVYYPDGLAKEARRAARDLPGDVRTRVKFSNLSETRLTLVITDDYGQ
jgi:LytR cell envelope-related transcriptional attenuator